VKADQQVDQFCGCAMRLRSDYRLSSSVHAEGLVVFRSTYQQLIRRGLHQLRREIAARVALLGPNAGYVALGLGPRLRSQNFPPNLPTRRRLCSTLGGRIIAS
jgi:hypothetical protein